MGPSLHTLSDACLLNPPSVPTLTILGAPAVFLLLAPNTKLPPKDWHRLECVSTSRFCKQPVGTSSHSCQPALIASGLCLFLALALWGSTGPSPALPEAQPRTPKAVASPSSSPKMSPQHTLPLSQPGSLFGPLDRAAPRPARPPPPRPPRQPEGGRPSLSPSPGRSPGSFTSVPSAHPLDRPSRRGAPAPGFVCAHRARPAGARGSPLLHTAGGVRPAPRPRALAWPAQPLPRDRRTRPGHRFPGRERGGAAPTAVREPPAPPRTPALPRERRAGRRSP